MCLDPEGMVVRRLRPGQTCYFKFYPTWDTGASAQTTGRSKLWGTPRLDLSHPGHADCVMVALGKPLRTKYLEVFPPMPLMREKTCSKNAEQENEGFQNNDLG